MKELKIHNNEKGNLLSIKAVENIYSDKNYFIFIISSLFALTKGCFYVEASRPNYDTNDLVIQLKGILNSNCNFRYTDFEISFWNTKVEEKLLEFLPVIWFAYEHISFCFFTENKIEIDIKRKSWYEITKGSKSYVLFKGVEDDVIWIGKSNELEFDLE
jgi:hypothetical protein